MSDSDIIIAPDDRPGARSAPDGRGQEARSKPRRAKATREPAAAPKARPARKRRLPLLFLTPVQKFAAGGVAVVALVMAVLVLWHSGAPQRAARATLDGLLDLTAQAGFRVEDVTVTGRGRTPHDDVVAALGVRRGLPIFGIDIEAAKDRLEAIPSVRAAAVERRLPSTLHVVIAERRPVALWQHDGGFALIDGDGHLIPGAIEGFEDLPLVVGDGAPVATADLLELVASEPKLAARVKSAVRVGDRRWDIRLDDPINGLEARLPEDEPAQAWHRLAGLEAERGLTRRHIALVDLRFPDRLVLRTASADARQQALTDHHKNGGG